MEMTRPTVHVFKIYSNPEVKVTSRILKYMMNKHL